MTQVLHISLMRFVVKVEAVICLCMWPSPLACVVRLSFFTGAGMYRCLIDPPSFSSRSVQVLYSIFIYQTTHSNTCTSVRYCQLLQRRESWSRDNGACMHAFTHGIHMTCILFSSSYFQWLISFEPNVHYWISFVYLNLWWQDLQNKINFGYFWNIFYFICFNYLLNHFHKTLNCFTIS